MTNECISKSPVVLFLGAGASAPLGKPLMGEFVRRLQSMPPFSDDLLFKAIVGQRPDLEFVFEELEEWKRKEYYAPRPPLGVLPSQGLDGLPAGSSGGWQLERLVRSAQMLAAELKREVFNAYREAGTGKGVSEVLGPLLGTMAEHLGPGDRPLVIFTTNYDPAVEAFCQQGDGGYDLFDGFVSQPFGAGYRWRREAIDNFDAGAHPMPCVVLFKLHGSTDWFRKGASFVKSPVATYLENDQRYENLLIYPAQRKIAIDDPYATAYEYFQRTLENARLCVVIGYSFRDYDALSKLRLAVSYNPGMRILVVDPSADRLCQMLKKRGIGANPIPENFGNPTATYLDRIREELERLPAG